MDKCIISVKGHDIAYADVNPSSNKTIFFIHGNSGSSRSWHKQLSDASLAKYRLVAFDLPAHGNSGVSNNPNGYYSVQGLGEVMAEAVSELSQGNPFILVGLSLGTAVLAEMLPYIKPDGIVLAGSNVMGGDYTMQKVFRPDIDGSVFFTDDATEESIRNYCSEATAARLYDDLDIIVADYLAVKNNFRPVLMKTAMEGKISDEIELLKKSGITVLVIFGSEEKFCNADYLDDMPFNIWHNTIFKISNAGHFVHIDQPSEFNNLVLEYLSETWNG